MLLARFWNNRQGGVAPMLALTIVPLMGAVGAAIDYGRANAARAAFQAALDSTALMLSKTAATQSSTELSTSATAILKSLYSRPEASNIAVSVNYTSVGGSKITLAGTATISTNFVAVIGYNNIDIKATATSTWGNTRLRVALVLDNTGSMSSDSKMTALKTASKNLLKQLKDTAAGPEDVYVSIIPFSKDVNVGAGNHGESWIRWDLWEKENGSCSRDKYKTKSKCLDEGKIWTPGAHSTWNGCVTDRDQNFDTTDTASTAGSTLYPAEQYSSCPVALMGLSNDWTALEAKIAAMTPTGNTNQGIGLQMGWQSLTAAPFSVPAEDPNYTYNKVVILLTDGLNTQNRWSSSQSSIDKRQEKTCDNAKAAGITIYAVQVNTGGDPTQSVLKECASDKNKFFLLTSASQMITTFAQIGTALSNLRLSM